ncbi:hypothetical protein QCN29_34295 [Streptomyces sp. HNM0663]|uniref:DUF4352 domain-containing protein n=1 Tax=Streptomyces chengmaiensis TaxID=3040919 RepID=A0ABT6HYI3_9ACTN|nr:hypothetical protein [Streptomyces chengmaiensis]MDH2393747.1 hypothetical protein [Streptomyces chengmaiensis]
MSSRAHSLLAAGAALALAGATACAGSSSDTDSTPTSTSSAPSEVASTADTIGAPPGAQVLGRPRKGEPFKITIDFKDTRQLDEFQITVRSVTCGKPLDPAVLAYAADSIGAPTPTPTPESGKQYCVVAMEALNVGKQKSNWNADNTVTLNVGDVAYSQTQKDAAYALDYAQYWNSKGQTGPTFGINPGSKGPVHGIFQIPADEQPTTVWVTSGTAIQTIDGVEPGYLVQL